MCLSFILCYYYIFYFVRLFYSCTYSGYPSAHLCADVAFMFDKILSIYLCNIYIYC